MFVSVSVSEKGAIKDVIKSLIKDLFLHICSAVLEVDEAINLMLLWAVVAVSWGGSAEVSASDVRPVF